MKPEIIITKSELGLLIKILLKTQQQKYFIDCESDKEIRFIVEIKIGENEVNLISSKLNWEWAEILERINPFTPVGDKSVRIDWENMEQGKLMEAVDEFSNQLISQIEWFTVEIIE